MKVEHRKIKSFNMHIAQQFTGIVSSTMDHQREGVKAIELTALGIFVNHKGMEKLIPFSNIQSIVFLPEATETK